MTTTTHCTIPKWFCRLGNNLIQLINALAYACQYKLDYVYMATPHDYLSSQVINVSGTDREFSLQTSECKLSNIFFYTVEIPGFQYTSNSDISYYLFNTYLMPIYKHKEIHCLAPADTENTLYIHVRSGDIFSTVKPHSLYVQPPLSYYDHIINEQKPDHIILVSEDNLNPCINALLAEYSDKITHVCNPGDPFKDISVLCRAGKIIFGFGTFSYYIMCVSRNLNTIWFPKYDNNNDIESPSGLSHIQTVYISLPKYMKPGDWKNTPAQRKIMLTYQIQ
jgi:hypothetical protein